MEYIKLNLLMEPFIFKMTSSIVLNEKLSAPQIAKIFAVWLMTISNFKFLQTAYWQRILRFNFENRNSQLFEIWPFCAMLVKESCVYFNPVE